MKIFRILLLGFLIVGLLGCGNNTLTIKMVSETKDGKSIDLRATDEKLEDVEDCLNTVKLYKEMPSKPKLTNEQLGQFNVVEEVLINYIGALRKYIREKDTRVKNCKP